MNADIPHDLWQELWKYDPNALVVVDESLRILVVNPAFCRMFQFTPENAPAMTLDRLLGDLSPLLDPLRRGEVVQGITLRFPARGRIVRAVGFPLSERGLLAAIFHDVSNEEKQRAELQRIREQAARKVDDVVENQMRVVQEVAGLLGETLAQTRVSLYELRRTIVPDEPWPPTSTTEA